MKKKIEKFLAVTSFGLEEFMYLLSGLALGILFAAKFILK